MKIVFFKVLEYLVQMGGLNTRTKSLGIIDISRIIFLQKTYIQRNTLNFFVKHVIQLERLQL